VKGLERVFHRLPRHLCECPQGLKPRVFPAVSARLKSCPDTQPAFKKDPGSLWIELSLNRIL
jgi:hypothetical protein